jgi:thioredoxin 1
MSETLRTFTDGNWAQEVQSAPGPVLVDFWASWCPPCRKLAPEVESLAHGLAGQVVVGKLDVDANPEAASRYGVRSIPTLVLFEGGREADRRLGFASAGELREWLERRATLVTQGSR